MYPVWSAVKGEYRDRHPSGLTMCIKPGETSKQILQRLLKGKLAMAMYAQRGQKVVVPALNKLCLNDIIGFDIASQSFFLKSVYGYYYHLAGYVSNTSPNWTQFSFKKCISNTMELRGSLFEAGGAHFVFPCLVYSRNGEHLHDSKLSCPSHIFFRALLLHSSALLRRIQLRYFCLCWHTSK